MRDVQEFQSQIQELCIDLIDKDIVWIISVNEDFDICLSAIWTNCTINQKVLSDKLTFFLHWYLCRQGRKLMISFNWSLSVIMHRDYSFFNFFNNRDWTESKKVC